MPLTFEDYVYPRWANGLGWAIVAFPCIIMVAVFIYVYCSRGGYTVSTETVILTTNANDALHILRTPTNPFAF